MEVLKHIHEELSILGLSNDKINDLKEIRFKNGVYLYRVKYKDKYLVIKYFEKDEFRREIEYYIILQSLNIPTIEVVGYTESTLLLEDIDKSLHYRLGIESDLLDVDIARTLALWYKKLHYEGASFLKNNNMKFYRETDYITKENIELIMSKTKTEANKVWQPLIDNLDLILLKVNEFEETFTYNDFYWTNLVVGKDKKEAFMFDYNMLGVGLRYSDIRNVCSSLSDEAGKVFLEAYGEINQDEKDMDDIVSILVNLAQACERDIFPRWAQESLDKVNNGELYERIINILFIRGIEEQILGYKK